LVSSTRGPGRRALLGLAAGAAVAAGTSAYAAASTEGRAARARHAHGEAHAESDAAAKLRALERAHRARLRVFARNLGTGATVAHRADERSPMCSVWKGLGAAAVLRDFDQHGEFLAKRLHYRSSELVAHSPITEKPENVAHGMTVEELCEAAVCYSDNSAANLLAREIGGPHTVTRFCRSLGDRYTRLDRYETDLNSAEPWRVTDTTTARAIARTYAQLVLGGALNRPDRKRLTDWMLHNTTGDEQFRKGLPDDWKLADRTGGGRYGTDNDVGIAWTPHGTPLVLAVLSTKPDQPDAEADNPLIAKAASVLADALR